MPPVYDFECPTCRLTEETYEEYPKRNHHGCPNCQTIMHLIPSAPRVRTFKPYLDTMMDKTPVMIETKKQKEFEMKKRGIRVCERGEKVTSWKDNRDRKYKEFHTTMEKKHGVGWMEKGNKSTVTVRNPFSK